MSMLGCGVCAKNSSQATTMAASEVFMSLAPRPNKWPSRCVGTKGSLVQAARSPVGTTSVWPANTKTWASVRPQRRSAHRLLTRPSAGPLSMASHTKPSGVKRCAIIGKQPWSLGVTEGRAMSASASRRVAWVSLIWGDRSVAQQVVDAGLGAGLGVHALDDDGGVHAVVGAVGGLLGQVTADHHRAAGHAPV